MTKNKYNKWQQMNEYKPKGAMGAIGVQAIAAC
jgi:hypothetical protein